MAIDIISDHIYLNRNISVGVFVNEREVAGLLKGEGEGESSNYDAFRSSEICCLEGSSGLWKFSLFLKKK